MNSEMASFMNKNTIILCVTPKFCLSIVSNFSWDKCKSQEKLKKNNAYAKFWTNKQRVLWHFYTG